MSIGLLFFAVNLQSKLDLAVYCRLSSFIFFRIAGQVDQHHHVLNPDADEFIPYFQATRAFETKVFGKLELGYKSYFAFLLRIYLKRTLTIMRTNWVMLGIDDSLRVLLRSTIITS